jgi:hypothetical protein
MRRVAIGTMLVLACVAVGCGSDDKASSTTAAAAVTTAVGAASTASATTAPSETTAAPTTAPGTTAAQGATTSVAGASSSAAPTSTTPNEGKAAASLLTAQDLPGWKVQADDGSDDSGLDFAAPECADLKAIGDDPKMQDDASVGLVAPDEQTFVQEQVTVGDPASVQNAFNVVKDPKTATCLTALFTAALQQPGLLPAGVSISGLQFAQQPLQGGEEAIAYTSSIGVTGGNANTSAQLGLRFDAIRTGGDIALLFTIALPGGAVVDPAAVATAAAGRLTP